jgi:hydroxyacylglutathione hydrolase
MEIQRFYDESLAHASYAVLAGKEIAIVDPARNPRPYHEFAKEHGAKIVAVVETHPHADFVSSHLEIHQTTGATIYTSEKTNAAYPHVGFDDGDEISLRQVILEAKNTPGHSPDSISVVVVDEMGQDYAVFTGDTLFVGDVGRPDLREDADDFATKREELARELYYSTRRVLMKLDPAVKVYPAHGAGSLCGKNISSDLSSTIGREVEENYALQPMSEKEFVDLILKDQSYIPKYFSYNVALNMKGADAFEESVKAVPRLNKYADLQEGVVVVDTRPAKEFKAGHVPGAINIMDGPKFETWLGSVVGPEEAFYLIGESEEALESLIRKCAKIGYEKNIKGALLNPEYAKEKSPVVVAGELKKNPQAFQIVDVRNDSELNEGKIFEQAVHIPLPELPERVHELNASKPVVVHCASGYRSAIGASILEKKLPGTRVYDLSGVVKDFK